VHDYSGTKDTLDNLRAFGWKGVVVRLGDKFHRLKHSILSGEDLRVKDESLEDTLQDFINYALFALILYRQEKASQSCSSNVHNEEGFAKAGTVVGDPEGFMREFTSDLEKTAAEGGISFRPKELPGMAETEKKGIVKWTGDIVGGEV